MSTLTSYSYMNLAEAMKRENYPDAAGLLGELQKNNEFLDHCPWFPATHGTYNEQTQATRLGKGAFSKANSAIPVISSGTSTIQEPVKMYEGESIVDDRILRTARFPERVRDSEDILSLEGAFQDWVKNVFYGNEGTEPDNFRSLARRRASLGTYCVSAGGSGGDTTSAWIIEFGRSAFHLAYPPGDGSPGLKNIDKGLQRVNAPDGTGQMYAWVRYYAIEGALVLRNERCLLRYANIEISGTSNTFDFKTFATLRNKLQSVGRNAVVFMNRDLKGQMEAVAYGDVKNGALTIRDIQGMGPVTYIMGIPIALAECITSTETAVT